MVKITKDSLGPNVLKKYEKERNRVLSIKKEAQTIDTKVETLEKEIEELRDKKFKLISHGIKKTYIQTEGLYSTENKVNFIKVKLRNTYCKNAYYKHQVEKTSEQRRDAVLRAYNRTVAFIEEFEKGKELNNIF
jgi:predicted RNase H-like nuclease (RuvC/YqgF family)